MQETVGHITEINRYPIKSFSGEGLTECEIASYGMLGDRFGSFYDETKSGWQRFVTARNIPDMLSYQASYKEGTIFVRSANGQTFGWNEELLSEIQSLTKTPITMSRLKEPHPEHPHLLSVDGASLLLITDTSLRKLGTACGRELDQRRFRGNFVITLRDDAISESDWIGKQLTIGEVQLQVDSFCERCTLITVDPNTLVKEPTILQKVNDSFDLQFGLYASVIRTGRIRLGDVVRIE